MLSTFHFIKIPWKYWSVVGRLSKLLWAWTFRGRCKVPHAEKEATIQCMTKSRHGPLSYFVLQFGCFSFTWYIPTFFDFPIRPFMIFHGSNGPWTMDRSTTHVHKPSVSPFIKPKKYPSFVSSSPLAPLRPHVQVESRHHPNPRPDDWSWQLRWPAWSWDVINQ